MEKRKRKVRNRDEKHRISSFRVSILGENIFPPLQTKNGKWKATTLIKLFPPN